jgi:site-specific DNA-methyltransferase (adenine-specific)
MVWPEDFIDKIICGDCLEVMKEIPDKTVDLVLTDPPYCIGTTSNGSRASWLDNNLIRPFFEIWFDEIKRLLTDDGEFYICTDWRSYPFIYPIVTTKLTVKNCIVWDYEWIKAGSHYRFSHEFIIYGLREKGKRKFSASERDVWRISPINFTSKDKHHQAEKPIPLMAKAITNSTKEGDIVLDPFLGSGTTAVACLELNRHFIGIELSSEYCEIAKNRISKVQSQLVFN